MGFLSKTAIAVGILALSITYLPYLFIQFDDYNYLATYRRLTDPEGDFITLKHGPVHYILEGPKVGSLVVILHGISTSAFAMRDIARSLADSGMTTLRLDFYGRGHSSSPDDLIHDEDLFVQQTTELLDTLVAEGKISAEQRASHHIVGWSLGGAVSLMYTSIFPERIKSAVLISPPGLPFEVPFTGKLALIPGLGEFLLAGAVGRFLLEDRVPMAFHNPSNFTEIVQDLKMLAFFHLNKEGFNSAFLSSLRNFKLHSLEPVYERVGKENFPIMFVWGEKDATVPVHCLDHAKQLIPRAESLVFADAGHCVHLEKHRETLPAITKFINSHDK